MTTRMSVYNYLPVQILPWSMMVMRGCRSCPSLGFSPEYEYRHIVHTALTRLGPLHQPQRPLLERTRHYVKFVLRVGQAPDRGTMTSQTQQSSTTRFTASMSLSSLPLCHCSVAFPKSGFFPLAVNPKAQLYVSRYAG